MALNIPPSQIPTTEFPEFYDKGYILVEDQIFDAEDIEGAAQWTLENAPSDDYLRRTTDSWRHSVHARNLACSPKVLELLEAIYGRKPLPYQTLNMSVGTEQPIHSDRIHFECTPKNYMCALWIALEDIDLRSGPLVYYPGSHRLPFLGPAELDLPPAVPSNVKSVQTAMLTYHTAIMDVIERYGLRQETAVLKKGQAFLWSANLLHGGAKIVDRSLTRLSQVVHYFFEAVMFWSPVFVPPGQMPTPVPAPRTIADFDSASRARNFI